ncbi:hypothetical protein C5167_025958 [Papaver somniferum]|uniref:Glycosyltransferase n=1 Tax=Papaver somniferum TaxID=3469 RepID=A0A4Y7JWW9_PAPSO|nr:UDP-glycosyltransferase 74E1-like [Papaver somniferum]RZC64205.1 hypothetical protein C5167_025958 [Papaver somniferum]
MKAYGAHILVIPYPLQGHINPILQFSKRLASQDFKVTVVLTNYLAKSMKIQVGPLNIETISDGYDDVGWSAAEDYIERFETIGSKTLADLIDRIQNSDDDDDTPPVSCVVYDSFVPWVLNVTQKLNLVGAVFFTQPLAVTSIYYYIYRGLLKVPVPDGEMFLIPGLPLFNVLELPSFVSDVESLPHFLRLLVDQFSNIEKADWVLFNTFDELEPEVLNWMAKLWRVRTIGPTIPSKYLDKRIEGDNDYGLNIFDTKRAECIDWLNAKEDNSVIYVSMGSMAVLKQEQIEEVAGALLGCDYNFLWVVRKTEENKIPSTFRKDISTSPGSEKGLVITWCPQLEVLSHPALGCFVTHCGWNSTMESLSLGVPMIAFPQWSDQPSNAKCIEDIWKVGIRVKVDEDGILRKKELELCIKEAMEGEKGKEMKKNAKNWKELAVQAVSEGGSSDKNVDEFLEAMKKEKVIQNNG